MNGQVRMDSRRGHWLLFALVSAALGCGTQVAVTVHFDGEGSGTVEAPALGKACGAECRLTIQRGEALELQASPAFDSVFLGWSGACTGSEPCALRPDEPTQVTATFARTRTLTVRFEGSGSGSVRDPTNNILCNDNCSYRFPAGARVSLTASAGAGSDFIGFSGACAPEATTCAVLLEGDAEVVAIFDRRVRLRVNLFGPAGSGRVVSAPGGIDCGDFCDIWLTPGMTARLNPIATSSLHRFRGWSGPCSGLDVCEVTVTADTEIGARFSPVLENVTALPAPPAVTPMDSGGYILGFAHNRIQDLGGGPLVPRSYQHTSTFLARYSDSHLHQWSKVLTGAANVDLQQPLVIDGRVLLVGSLGPGTADLGTGPVEQEAWIGVLAGMGVEGRMEDVVVTPDWTGLSSPVRGGAGFFAQGTSVQGGGGRVVGFNASLEETHSSEGLHLVSSPRDQGAWVRPAVNGDAGCISWAPGRVAIARLGPGGACEWFWQSPGSDAGISIEAVDAFPGKGVVVVGQYSRGALELGSQTLPLPPTAVSYGFVIRLDDEGNLLWARTLQNVPHHQRSITLAAVALLENGDVLVGGGFGGKVNFGQGEVLSTNPGAFLVQLGAEGAFAWSHVLPSKGPNHSQSITRFIHLGQDRFVVTGPHKGELDLGTARLAPFPEESSHFFAVMEF